MDRFVAYLCLIGLALSSTHASLMMVPEKPSLMVLEGDRLQLQCIHEYASGTTPNSLYFTKDGVPLPISMSTKPQDATNQMWLDTHTYTKEQTTIADSGNYQCKLDTAGTTSNIHVFVFRMPNLVDAELMEGSSEPLYLACDLEDGDQYQGLEYTVSWEHNNVSISEGSKYQMVNNSLKILKPGRKDMGEYQCTITFFPDSEVDKHNIKPGSISVLARPAVDSHDNNKNMVQGDDLELKCKVSGFPQPEVTWFKDGAKVNVSKRVHLEKYGGTETGKLIIFSLDYEDEGMYSCFAQNEINNMAYNATGEMRLRVKDKLAALWPFLGIVAEVIILCAIILCYEKSRSKKLSDDDDGVDGNVENTVDHGDVRHRRT